MLANDSQRKAVKKYDKANTKMYPVKVNLNTEKDIFDHLSKVGNVNGYIKELIRRDINSTK